MYILKMTPNQFLFQLIICSKGILHHFTKPNIIIRCITLMYVNYMLSTLVINVAMCFFYNILDKVIISNQLTIS